MLRTRRTSFDDPAAREAIALLDRVLPGARSAAEADPDATLIVASRSHPQGERVVGCVGVAASSEATGRLIGPVVDPQLQQQGIGRRLLAEGEREALGNRRLRRLECPAHARHAEFLVGLGWKAGEREGDRVCFVLEVDGDDEAPPHRAGSAPRSGRSGGPGGAGPE